MGVVHRREVDRNLADRMADHNLVVHKVDHRVVVHRAVHRVADTTIKTNFTPPPIGMPIPIPPCGMMERFTVPADRPW